MLGLEGKFPVCVFSEFWDCVVPPLSSAHFASLPHHSTRQPVLGHQGPFSLTLQSSHLNSIPALVQPPYSSNYLKQGESFLSLC